MAVLHHDLHLKDQAAMLAMRAALAVSAKPVLGPDSRPGFDAMISRKPAPDGVAFEAGEVGGVAGWWCRPPGADPSAAISYLHGGAFVLGFAVAYRHFAGQVAARAGASAFVANYALAPENPFPAALSDARAAFEGLGEVGARRITLCGDSAGGGLALALLLATTRTPRPPLGAAVMSPWIDLSLSGASMQTRAAADPLLSRDALAEAVRLYLNGGDPHDPQVSVLDGDFDGMAPVRIHVGDAEVLLDDAVRFAERAEGAGRVCDAHVWDGMVHVFPSNLLLHAARATLDDVGVFLRDRLHKGAVS